MSSQQPSCELWMPCRKNEQSLCKCLLVALHIGPNTPQTRKALNSAISQRLRSSYAGTPDAFLGVGGGVKSSLRRDAP